MGGEYNQLTEENEGFLGYCKLCLFTVYEHNIDEHFTKMHNVITKIPEVIDLYELVQD